MDEISTGYEQLAARFAEWASGQDDIRAAVVVGSRARSDHPADEWADLDIVIAARDPGLRIEDSGWIEQMGKPWVSFVEPTADGRTLERRVLFAPGLDVDFAFFPAALFQEMVGGEIPRDVADVLRRGVRVLLDKDGLIAPLLPFRGEVPPPAPPTPEAFANLVNDFWYHSVWAAKHLRRGELWWAKSSSDMGMKELLRHMLEWHARATRGADHDTWLRGRFLEEWADPRAVAALRSAFAHYDREDIARALLATMDLFRWVSRETAEQLGYPYPEVADEQATRLTVRILAGGSLL